MVRKLGRGGNRGGEARSRRGGEGHFSGAAFAGHKDADAFEHFDRGACTLGQEGIGTAGAIVSSDSARDDHCRKGWVKLLGAADEFVAIHLRHDEVAEQKVERAGH